MRAGAVSLAEPHASSGNRARATPPCALSCRRSVVLGLVLAPWLLTSCGPPRLARLVVTPGLTSARLASGGLAVLPVSCNPGLLEPAICTQLTQKLASTLQRKRPILHASPLPDDPKVRELAERIRSRGRLDPGDGRVAPGHGHLAACHVSHYAVVQDSEMRDRQVGGKNEPYTLWSAEATMTARVWLIDAQTGAASLEAEHTVTVRNEQESRHTTLLGEVLSAFEGGLKPKVAEVGGQLFSEIAENLPA